MRRKIELSEILFKMQMGGQSYKADRRISLAREEIT